MRSLNRRQKILSLLENRQQIGTDELVDIFHVSRETIRRHLLEFEAEGLVKRVHGGVMLVSSNMEEPFESRRSINHREKASIAQVAAGLVQPGQSIFIDAGTTTQALAREIASIPDITVITNSFDIVTSFHKYNAEVNAILLGGRIISDVPGTYGELTLSEILRFRTDLVITSPVALHPEYGAANYDLYEAEVARTMITRASRFIMLADHTKLNNHSKVQYCSCSDIDLLITGAAALSSDIDILKKAGIKEILQAPE